MKHRQICNPKIGIVNPDGHAIGVDIGATSVRAAILSHGTTDGRPSVSVHGCGHVDLPRPAGAPEPDAERLPLPADHGE